MRIDEYIPVNGRYIDDENNENQHYPLALRRPRLTLRHLNKLRKIRDLRRIEQIRREMNLPIIYKAPDTDRKSKH